jgi:hypothetical protein
MKKTTKLEEAPPPHDIEGWRVAVVDTERLKRFRMEDVVRAAQSPGLKADRQIYNALMGHISRVLLRTLRRSISTGWTNGGQDLIDTVHDQLIDAILRPSSADGKELGRRFWAVLKTRTYDGVRAERTRQGRYTSTEVSFTDEPGDKAADTFEHLDQKIDIERILECVPDARKALAYRFHLEGVPLKTKKGTTSISKTLDVSDKTASQWIDEVEAIIKEKIGERNDQ